MDALILSRIQFAANITFHILFPAITIALGWFLLFFKLRYNATKNYKWMDIYFFWTKIFALCFALGVVSGITMSFQFGTNWPGFMATVGNVAGPLLGYEVLTAFFLEATFLGIMLFGFRKVKPWVHNLATILVATGTTLSAFWILVLNSWMQTPVGFVMVDGRAIVTDWMQVIFNPSLPYRLVHKLLASGLTAAFLIAGVSAFRYLKGYKSPSVISALRVALIAAAFLIPVQILMGDLHGLNTLKHQPQKVAAMEGLWNTKKNVPLVLFAIPDEQNKKNLYSLEIPNLTSIILTHSKDGEVKGLNAFKDNPPVKPIFYSFRIMVGVGFLMLFVSWIGVYYILRKKEFPKILGIKIKIIKARPLFLNVLKGITDPEEKRKAIGKTFIDVFDKEPLDLDDEFRKLDNITMTTHFGGDTEGTNSYSGKLCADAIKSFIETGKVSWAVNAKDLGWV